MKLFDKLKNVFFEEEEIIVEEPIAPPSKKEPIREKEKIAKKIDFSFKKKEIPSEDEIVKEEISVDNSNEFDNNLVTSEPTTKFPIIFEEDDFVDEKPLSPKEENIYEPPLYQKPDNNSSAYSGSLYSNKKPNDYNNELPISNEYAYSYKEEEKKVFRPSPVISPVYGILDKNYKKDEIVTKKEIHISSSYAPTSIDKVRAKAFGESNDFIEEKPSTTKFDKIINKPKELVDMSNDDAPIVDKVTVADAEEYFSDLGLEYNVDYKDESKEKATGRRIKEDEIPDLPKNDKLEDNLFDLIDSMYDEKE